MKPPQALQNLRKTADFELNDHIEVVYSDASDGIQAALEQFGDYISGETLADSLSAGELSDDYQSEKVDLKGESVTIGVKRVS